MILKSILRKPYYYVLNKWKDYNNHVIMPKKVKRYFMDTGHKTKLKRFKNIHKGERCFIIGNGPSLTAEDLDKLKNEYTFASNFIGKMFDKTDWRPTYYCVMDPNFVKESMEEFVLYDKKEMFVAVYSENFKSASKWFNNDNINFCEMTHGVGRGKLPKFSNDISKIMYGGHTVTYSLLQLAVTMGFSKIYLIGVDNNFALNKGFDGMIKESGTNSHFYKDTKQVPANIEGMSNAYIAAKKYCDENGIEIYNATRGGKLEIYERVDFDEIFIKQGE